MHAKFFAVKFLVDASHSPTYTAPGIHFPVLTD